MRLDGHDGCCSSSGAGRWPLLGDGLAPRAPSMSTLEAVPSQPASNGLEPSGRNLSEPNARVEAAGRRGALGAEQAQSEVDRESPKQEVHAQKPSDVLKQREDIIAQLSRQIGIVRQQPVVTDHQEKTRDTSSVPPKKCVGEILAAKERFSEELSPPLPPQASSHPKSTAPSAAQSPCSAANAYWASVELGQRHETCIGRKCEVVRDLCDMLHMRTNDFLQLRVVREAEKRTYHEALWNRDKTISNNLEQLAVQKQLIESLKQDYDNLEDMYEDMLEEETEQREALEQDIHGLRAELDALNQEFGAVRAEAVQETDRKTTAYQRQIDQLKCKLADSEGHVKLLEWMLANAQVSCAEKARQCAEPETDRARTKAKHEESLAPDAARQEEISALRQLVLDRNHLVGWLTDSREAMAKELKATGDFSESIHLAASRRELEFQDRETKVKAAQENTKKQYLSAIQKLCSDNELALNALADANREVTHLSRRLGLTMADARKRLEEKPTTTEDEAEATRTEAEAEPKAKAEAEAKVAAEVETKPEAEAEAGAEAEAEEEAEAEGEGLVIEPTVYEEVLETWEFGPESEQSFEIVTTPTWDNSCGPGAKFCIG